MKARLHAYTHGRMQNRVRTLGGDPPADVHCELRWGGSRNQNTEGRIGRCDPRRMQENHDASEYFLGYTLCTANNERPNDAVRQRRAAGRSRVLIVHCFHVVQLC